MRAAARRRAGQAARDLRGADPAEALRLLTEAQLDDEQGRDDVCLLLLSWHGS